MGGWVWGVGVFFELGLWWVSLGFGCVFVVWFYEVVYFKLLLYVVG